MLYEEEIKGKDVSRRSSQKNGKSRGSCNPTNQEELSRKNENGTNGKQVAPYLMAASIISKRGMNLNREGNSKIVGHIQGVEVGDHFYFRMELCCIGLHTLPQGGIDYTSSKSGPYEASVATSIISSGSYDDTDNGEVLIYTGQGGRSPDGKQTEDQKMERGNLALENSMKWDVPIRVIRGIKDASSPTNRIYIYDGLYKVEQCWLEKGKLGFAEFKFRLQRLSEQPTLGSSLMKLSRMTDSMERKGLCMADISCGKDVKPISVVNTEDDMLIPPYFEYSTSLDVSCAGTMHSYRFSQGCNCVDQCVADQSCSCFSQNGNEFAYLHSGQLVKERSMIYECGTTCKCSASCWNRSTQRAPIFRLDVFKTKEKGWGLRSLDPIPAGSLICEYTGKVIESAQSLQCKDYILDVESLPSYSPPWGHVSKYLEGHSSKDQSTLKPNLIIDSSQVGNAARFINHSCSSNVLVQCVLRCHTECPVVMLFAMDNIPPFQELTIDFGNSSKIVSRRTCLCKSADCRGNFSG
ncbi:hypothetical protein KP509_12G010000 [Ceratopteris richardii]|nr:hypothetical protein KP509_12G010000 [Ceratopteris richardii]